MGTLTATLLRPGRGRNRHLGWDDLPHRWGRPAVRASWTVTTSGRPIARRVSSIGLTGRIAFPLLHRPSQPPSTRDSPTNTIAAEEV